MAGGLWREYLRVVGSMADGIEGLIRLVRGAEGWSREASEAFCVRLDEVAHALAQIAGNDHGMGEVLRGCAAACDQEIRSMVVPDRFVAQLRADQETLVADGNLAGFADGEFGPSVPWIGEAHRTAAAYERLGQYYGSAPVPTGRVVLLPPIGGEASSENTAHAAAGTMPAAANGSLGGLSNVSSLANGLSSVASMFAPSSTPTTPATSGAPTSSGDLPTWTPPSGTSLAAAGGAAGVGAGSAVSIGPASPMTTAAVAAAAGRTAPAVVPGPGTSGTGAVGMYPPMTPSGSNQAQPAGGRTDLVDDSGAFDPPQAPTGVLA
jgi:hypothetical protein